MSIIVLLLLSYLAFCIIFILQSNQGGLQSNQQSYSEKMIFLQVVLISLFNALAASIYVFMQYIHINEVIIIIGQLCWLNAHGGGIQSNLRIKYTLKTKYRGCCLST
ncbi:unnamed protein product [Meloidogyne enterolobii]|uniref:Uncharacterized protein n=1 Tax=Meloidogyne enterolobii TaxID=390850 RepID=A0ACB0YZP2_MELEN